MNIWLKKLQYSISDFTSRSEIENALRYVKYCVFSTITKLICIEKIRTRTSHDSVGFGLYMIVSTTNYKIYFQLFEQSNIKNINFSTDMLVKHVEIKKKDWINNWNNHYYFINFFCC